MPRTELTRLRFGPVAVHIPCVQLGRGGVHETSQDGRLLLTESGPWREEVSEWLIGRGAAAMRWGATRMLC